MCMKEGVVICYINSIEVYQFHLYSAYANVWKQLRDVRIKVTVIRKMDCIFLLRGNNGGTVIFCEEDNYIFCATNLFVFSLTFYVVYFS